MISLKRYTPTSRVIDAGGLFDAGGTLSEDRTLALGATPANRIFAGPASGASAAPTARALSIADLPSGIDGKPIESTCGGTFQELTGGVILTDSSDQWLIYDTGGTDRTITLPNWGPNNPRFTIVNIGNSSGNLLVVEQTGRTIATIGPGQFAECFPDGVGIWLASTPQNVDGSPIADENIHFGGNSLAAGSYLKANTYYNVGCDAILDTDTQYQVSGAGQITHAYIGVASSAAWTFIIWKNGVATYNTGSVTGTFEHSIELSAPITVAVGDLIAFEVDAVPVATAAKATLRLIYDRPKPIRGRFPFGGNVSASSACYFANDVVTSNAGRTNGRSDHSLPADGIIKQAVVNVSTGDTTTVLRILKNGVLEQTFQLTGPRCIIDLSPSAYVRTDLITVQWTVGSTAPGSGQVTLEFAMSGYVHHFGGSIASSNFASAYGVGNAGAVSTNAYSSWLRAPHGGRLYATSWWLTAAPTAGTGAVRRNGATLETLAFAASITGSVVSTDRSRIYRGDYIEIQGYATGAPTGGIYTVLFT